MASRIQIGLALRLLGPLIQIVGIWIFLNSPDPRALVAGVPARWVALGALGVGLVMVAIGLVLSHRRRRPKLRVESTEDLRDPV